MEDYRQYEVETDFLQLPTEQVAKIVIKVVQTGDLSPPKSKSHHQHPQPPHYPLRPSEPSHNITPVSQHLGQDPSSLTYHQWVHTLYYIHIAARGPPLPS